MSNLMLCCNLIAVKHNMDRSINDTIILLLNIVFFSPESNLIIISIHAQAHQKIYTPGWVDSIRPPPVPTCPTSLPPLPPPPSYFDDDNR